MQATNNWNFAALNGGVFRTLKVNDVMVNTKVRLTNGRVKRIKDAKKKKYCLPGALHARPLFGTI